MNKLMNNYFFFKSKNVNVISSVEIHIEFGQTNK